MIVKLEDIKRGNVFDILEKIEELNKEISLLPSGSITTKRIGDKVYYYHRISKSGRRFESYIPFEKVDEVKKQIMKRKDLEEKLKQLKNSIPLDKKGNKKDFTKFKTFVRINEQLLNMALIVKKYKHRECYDFLSNYIFGETQDKVLILYGLRRTGKTTLIRQVILEMSEEERKKTAFIQIDSNNTLSELYSDLKLLEEMKYKYVFIDEVTQLEDFIEGSAIFSDVFASSGMKIVLSGTDSLGFMFAAKNQLYDRSIMVRTTFISYREFEDVLGIKGIDEYIRYGGTMSLGGLNYNDNSPFSTKENVSDYVDSAIAKNIQHSLKYYQDGGHFRLLYDLYEKGELTNAINRVVENINHYFTKEVITKTFKSSDLKLAERNLMNDRDKPIILDEKINREFVEKTLKSMIDVLNKEEQTIDIDDACANQIKEYLSVLDLISEIELIHLPYQGKIDKKIVLVQPGMRYALAEALVNSLILDQKFISMNYLEINRILERVLDTVKGMIMEEIVLLETKLSQSMKNIYQVQFAIGEIDMIVQDSSNKTCSIYEIKHSKEIAFEQYRHLIDDDKCNIIKKVFGNITGKYVIYRGSNKIVDNINYLNVEEYLKNINK
ncbi:MAG: AAA family ATPase [Bacilli bacterium]|nr:AAA family ATPase [Bacilli bacterium]